jgi:dethiobiotin synthetase
MTIARFITSTGTGLGKTLVTAALAYQARRQGKSVHAMKPMVTGLTPQTQAESDPAILLAALGRPLNDETLAAVSPFRFAAPLAPAMAAAQEGRRVSLEAIVAASRPKSARSDIVLVEGIGGVMVPLARGVTVLDWIAELRYPVILVVGSYLGTISHTLTAAEVLHSRKVPIAGIVVSETAESAVGLLPTVRAIGDFVDAPVYALPRIPGQEPWWRAPDLMALVQSERELDASEAPSRAR